MGKSGFPGSVFTSPFPSLCGFLYHKSSCATGNPSCAWDVDVDGCSARWDGQGDPARSHPSSPLVFPRNFLPFHCAVTAVRRDFYSWQNRGRAQALGFFGRFCAPQEHPGDVRENIHGVARPLECPAGHYCPPGTRAANQYPCPEGTYSRQPGLANPRDCRPCPGGTFCARAGGNCVWIEQNPHLLWVWERMKGSVQFIQMLRSICSHFWEPLSPI